MNKYGFHISKLHVTGTNVEPAKLKFKSGFNVVSGLHQVNQ